MPLIQTLQNVPEEILQRYLTGTKSRELYEITYISSIRPDPRDLDQILLVSVTVRMWARDARDAYAQLEASPQHAQFGKFDEQDLAILSLVSAAPVGGNSGGGIDEGSMLIGTGSNSGDGTDDPDESVRNLRDLNRSN